MQVDLVERARRGDHDAFAVLVRTSIFRLDAAARLILRDPDEAKDAVQETLVARLAGPAHAAERRIASMPGSTGCSSAPVSTRRAGSGGIASTSSLLRSTRPAIGDHSSMLVDRDQLERGFDRLEPEERALIVLHYYLDLPLPEVAGALGIPLGTAKSRLHRAVGLMRAALDAEMRLQPELPQGGLA